MPTFHSKMFERLDNTLQRFLCEVFAVRDKLDWDVVGHSARHTGKPAASHLIARALLPGGKYYLWAKLIDTEVEESADNHDKFELRTQADAPICDLLAVVSSRGMIQSWVALSRYLWSGFKNELQTRIELSQDLSPLICELAKLNNVEAVKDEDEDELEEEEDAEVDWEAEENFVEDMQDTVRELADEVGLTAPVVVPPSPVLAKPQPPRRIDGKREGR